MSFCAQCKQNIYRPTCNISTAEIDQKLRSSYGSSIEEAADKASPLIEVVDHDLSACSKELQRLQVRTAYLVAQRERLSDYKMKLCSLRSPIRRLPPDLLMEIFVECCPINDFSDFNVLPPAMVLASVCSRWREVAIVCARMWSSLTVHQGAMSQASNTRLRVALEIYLLRSKQHPLDVIFKEVAMDLPMDRLPLLVDQYPRWRTVTFANDYTLMKLRLPLQKQLMTSGGSFKSLFRSNKHHVTEVSCAASKPYNYVLACPNLKHLSLKRGYGGTASKRQDSMASSIRTLSVEWSGDLDLYGLRVPSLTELEVDFLPDPSRKSPFTAISTFLTRSKCLLTTLSLSNVTLADTELIAVLAPLKSLTRLMLSDPKSSRPIIARPLTKLFVESLHEYRQTSLHSAVQPMLPKLRYLTLKPSSTNSNAEFIDGFVETVRSRWCPLNSSENLTVYRLWSVELHLAVDVDATVYRNRLSFERPAMRVVVKGPRGYLV